MKGSDKTFKTMAIPEEATEYKTMAIPEEPGDEFKTMAIPEEPVTEKAPAKSKNVFGER